MKSFDGLKPGINNNNNSMIYRAQNWYKSSNALKSKKGESRDRHGTCQGITKVAKRVFTINVYLYPWKSEIQWIMDGQRPVSAEISCVQSISQISFWIFFKLRKWLAMAKIWTPYYFGSPGVKIMLMGVKNAKYFFLCSSYRPQFLSDLFYIWCMDWWLWDLAIPSFLQAWGQNQKSNSYFTFSE